MRRIVTTTNAPPPAGHYSQAVIASGEFLFVSGQTPRHPDGERMTGQPFVADARQALTNLKAIVEAAGYDLAKDCVKVVVYLRDLGDKSEFDAVFAEFTGPQPPARSIVQSSFKDFSVEIEAVLVR